MYKYLILIIINTTIFNLSAQESKNGILDTANIEHPMQVIFAGESNFPGRPKRKIVVHSRATRNLSFTIDTPAKVSRVNFNFALGDVVNKTGSISKIVEKVDWVYKRNFDDLKKERPTLDTTSVEFKRILRERSSWALTKLQRHLEAVEGLHFMMIKRWKQAEGPIPSNFLPFDEAKSFIKAFSYGTSSVLESLEDQSLRGKFGKHPFDLKIEKLAVFEGYEAQLVEYFKEKKDSYNHIKPGKHDRDTAEVLRSWGVQIDSYTNNTAINEDGRKLKQNIIEKRFSNSDVNVESI